MYDCVHIVASELKDPICRSNECQIGSFSSEATICTQSYWSIVYVSVTVYGTHVRCYREASRKNRLQTCDLLWPKLNRTTPYKFYCLPDNHHTTKMKRCTIIKRWFCTMACIRYQWRHEHYILYCNINTKLMWLSNKLYWCLSWLYSKLHTCF